MQSKTVLKDAMIQWIIAEKCSHALTLNINREMGLDQGAKRVGKLLARIDRKRFGAGFYKHPTEYRLVAFVFPENLASNLHFHVAMRFDTVWRGDHDEAGWAQFIEAEWRKITLAGSIALKPVVDCGWAKYITKQFLINRESYWLSNDFHTARPDTIINDWP